MRLTLTVKDLTDFEKGIAEDFADRKIPHPIHLSWGNEQRLFEIFRDLVGPEDWIFCSWRSHLHCLLKGVPPERLRADIHRGRSIALCYPDYNIYSSAIVGGTAPIAVGVAAGLKMRKDHGRAIVFMGDMTAQTGIARESMHYSWGHNLPILWIVEDNGLSVMSDTESLWPKITLGRGKNYDGPRPMVYHYGNKYPHSGIGTHVEF